jgi:hypothetical protein
VGAAGSSVAGLSIWTLGIGTLLWPVLSGLATVSSVLKPVIKIEKHIELYSKLTQSYGTALNSLEVVVGNMQQGLLSDKDDREYDRIVRSVNVVEEAHEHPSKAGDIIRRVDEFKGWDEF